MTRKESFVKNAKRTHGHRSAMRNSAWCDLNKKCTVLKVHDTCHNPNCICQKQLTVTPKQFQPESNGFKNTMKKILRRSQTAGKKIFETDDKYSGTSDRDGCWSKKQK